MFNQVNIAIIGGGISGMATALAIQDLAAQRAMPPPNIVILEAENRVGGKIQTSREEGYVCEWGVNGFLNKEPKTFELCQRLQLMDQLLPASTAFNKRYIYTRGKLRQVHMHPLKFMLSSLLPLGAKWRLAQEAWLKNSPLAGQDESVASFARRRIGPVGFEILVDPMQTGIYAGDPEQMSVASCFPRVVEVEQQYGSLIRGMAKLAKERKQQGGPIPTAGPSGHLTSFKGGMQILVDRLAEVLGDCIRCSSPVLHLQRKEQGYLIDCQGAGKPIQAQTVILACPAHAAAAMTSDLDHELSSILHEIPYPPMAVVGLGYAQTQLKRPLDGFGFLAPRTAGLRLLGALWASATFPDNAPQGYSLLRVMVGGARDLSVLDLNDDELIRLTTNELYQVQGVQGEPAFARVFRHPLAIPQYIIDHSGRLLRIEARLKNFPGLYLTGNAYQGIGVNDCARNAGVVAERVMQQSIYSGSHLK